MTDQRGNGFNGSDRDKLVKLLISVGILESKMRVVETISFGLVGLLCTSVVVSILALVLK